jgi:molybdopterin molybdotransferase
LISEEKALKYLFDNLPTPSIETLSIFDASNRVLAKKIISNVDKPPFSASVMDGYAISDLKVEIGKEYKLVGEVSAGGISKNALDKGQAVRIFTGAPIPKGTKKIIIQENIKRYGDLIKIIKGNNIERFIRPKGSDFRLGKRIEKNTQLNSSILSLVASMNIANVTVYKKPTVAIITTGDELIMPGEILKNGKVISSNSVGISTRLSSEGAEVRVLPIARDNADSLKSVIKMALDANFIITVGGASVGDYDIVKRVLTDLGMKLKFSKVAIKPGKPLFSGILGKSIVIGLPGNPVSTLVCTEIFVIPAIKKFLKLRPEAYVVHGAKLTKKLQKNGSRKHYMRGYFNYKSHSISVKNQQDSSLLSILADSNALVIREPNAAALEEGQRVSTILLK